MANGIPRLAVALKKEQSRAVQMPIYRVTRTVHFSYGHRLLDYAGKCRHLHGHNGVLEVDIEGEKLDSQGMVADFGQVRDIVKEWVDSNLDHRMVLCRKDPVVPLLESLGEPLYLMDENPTAENIARLVFEQTRCQGLKVAEVRLWETPTNCAMYRQS